jgi:hypothetical protein
MLPMTKGGITVGEPVHVREERLDACMQRCRNARPTALRASAAPKVGGDRPSVRLGVGLGWSLPVPHQVRILSKSFNSQSGYAATSLTALANTAIPIVGRALWITPSPAARSR